MPWSPCLFTLRTAADWVHAAAPGRCDEVRHSQSGGNAIPGPATASRPTAVLTSPCIAMGSTKAAARELQLADTYDMAEVTLQRHPLAATAGLVWNTDLPRPLQQILFDTADGVGRAPLAQAS